MVHAVAPFHAPAVLAPADLAEKSEHLAKLERKARSLTKDVYELEKKPKQKSKLDELRARRDRAIEEASVARRAIERARLIEPDAGPRPPRSLEQYRRYAAEKLGVPEREVSPELARWLQTREAQAIASASSKLASLSPSGPITSREDARRYFRETYQAIGKLAQQQSDEQKRRKAWEKQTGEKWALDSRPENALARGLDRDSPLLRYATTLAEKNTAAELRDLVFRLRSTALSGLSPELDGSEKSLTDVFEDARYAQALAYKAIGVAEHEASARFFDLVKHERGAIELAVSAENTYRSAREKLRELWTSAPKR